MPPLLGASMRCGGGGGGGAEARGRARREWGLGGGSAG
jgi:hypothetical protein